MRPDSATRELLVEMHYGGVHCGIVEPLASRRLRADLCADLPHGLPVFGAGLLGCMHFVSCWFSMRYIFGSFF